MKILDILNLIASNDKRTFKEDILNQHKNNYNLRHVFFACYNPDIVFWIKKTPAFIINDSAKMNLSKAIDLLINKIASRKITGNEAIAYYKYILESLDQDDAEVLIRIVNRDLRCGVNVPTINKIWPMLIPTFDIMLAQNNPKNIVFPCYGQKKMDGMRCIATVTMDDEVVIRSRNGTRITCLNHLYNDIRVFADLGETIDGELVCDDLPRHKSNGILNKAIRNTISDNEKQLIKYFIWDIVDYTYTIPYSMRYETLFQRAAYDTKYVKLLENTILNNSEEIDNMLNVALWNGDEGIVVKNRDSFWVPKRTFDIVKYKAIKSCELLVTDWEEGTGANAGRLGALVCKSSDEKIIVKVGTGFSDNQRTQFTKEYIVGKIIEVCFNDVINNSLFLPRFIKIRSDRFDANSFDEIINIK